ncbi:MAG: Na+/H+ antiporter subunit E [Candidatus Methanofastidiosia archaeon]|jgi:multicomponent Na+:H+ antiporter subunit E
MKPTTITAVAVLVFYLALTAGTGNIIFWSGEEIIAGILLSLVAGIASRKIFFKNQDYRMLNPVRWFYFIVYLGPFLFAMAKANVDVAYRVITGKINPGIVKISPDLKTDLGITMLGNSITLTPGTLTVEIDEKTHNLYIHWINVKHTEPQIEEVCNGFPQWIRRIAE